MKYDRFILAYAQGQPMKECAKSAGMSVRSAQRLRHQPDFKQRVRAVRDVMLDEAAGRLAEGLTLGIDTLKELATAGPPAVRLGAARAIIASYIDISAQFNIVERVGELERRLAEADGKAAGRPESRAAGRVNGYLSPES